MLIGRGEAPVIGVKNFMRTNESIFIVEGSMPNERSAALVDDLFGVRYVDGKFVEFLDINTVVNRTRINSELLANEKNVTDEMISGLSSLLDDVVSKAKEKLDESYRKYKAATDPLIDAEVDKLAELEERHRDYQLSLFTDERRRSEAERRVDELFDSFTKWVTETTGYPKNEALYNKVKNLQSVHNIFVIPPLKAHIFDPEYTPTLVKAKIRNCVMLRIIDLMSLTKSTGKKGSRRGRISYANLGINQMGAVYEALLSYRGFIAEQDLYEVKKAGDTFNELDVGYFVTANELEQYTEEERVRYESGDKKGQLRVHPKGEFIYRLAGREREKSASYYTPESLTQCLVKYALKELLKDKTAEDILNLTVCESKTQNLIQINDCPLRGVGFENRLILYMGM